MKYECTDKELEEADIKLSVLMYMLGGDKFYCDCRSFIKNKCLSRKQLKFLNKAFDERFERKRDQQDSRERGKVRSRISSSRSRKPITLAHVNLPELTEE